MKEITPEDYRCAIGLCPAVFEITPEEARCGIGACPGVFEITPQREACVIGSCPAVFTDEENLLIIGTTVGDGKISVPKGILAGIWRTKEG